MAEIRKGVFTVEVEVVSAPDGQPMVLLQLPDSFTLMNAKDTLLLAAALVEASQEITDGSLPERVRTYDAHTGEPHDDVLRTKSGKVLTEADIQRLADEAQEASDD